MLYEVILSFAIELNPLVLFIMLYIVVLTFESVDKILKCDHSNRSGEGY